MAGAFLKCNPVSYGLHFTGIYLDKLVVVDGTLVTSGFPANLPDLCREALKLLA